MAKKNKENKKTLMQEVREEGLFSEAEKMAKQKKVYVISGFKDSILILLYFFIAIMIFAAVNVAFN